MPSFASRSVREKAALLEYLGYRVSPRDTAGWRSRAVVASPYEFAGYERWRDSSGYPAIAPPWGTLSAIDLNTGDYRWRIPLGEFAALTRRMPITGTEQYGGPIVTKGGLVFIAATQDAKFRAFDKNTGRLLWEVPLPAPGFATPSTFAVGGRQFVVVAAGGGKLGSRSSDTYVAFSLP
jgi:quinoprotein glucose dehydrogenase